MPGRDGTGPSGVGAMSGRGLGFCSNAGIGRSGLGFGRGLGLGLGDGCRRGKLFHIASSDQTEKELLSAEKKFLEAKLNALNKHLDKMKEREE